MRGSAYLPSAMQKRGIDIAILGGGLAGGLIALTLAEKRPELNLLLIERGETFGGNHVWSSFATDIDSKHAWLLEPLIANRWSGYDVHFPGYSRTLKADYRSITSERLDAALRAALPGDAIVTGAEVAEAGQDFIRLAGKRKLTVGGVIDARGLSGGMPHMAGGWQVFVGQLLELEEPHGLARPVVIDARVDQSDGYRFVYCLPFGERQVFVEDTYYADTSELDLPKLKGRIAAYAGEQGWKITGIGREEAGVLPVIADGDFEAFWPDWKHEPARAGARAALVHPMTSYSLPDAVRFAHHIAGLDDLSGAALAGASYDYARSHWRKGDFYRMLAKMFFGAARPDQRYKVLARFYTLSEGLIERFYAGKTSTTDRMRLLAGKPPVPIADAMASLAGMGRPLAPLGEAA
ncbi:MAG: lycopene beta-cyclase CrtY [Novosphingobium sp.]|nr:lycopene beta-cyclase CrtY [Novosphingobium sp.]